MIVLITGATGLVGSKISTLFKEEGIMVHYLTTSKNKITTSTNYKGFYWNPETKEIDTEAFHGVTTIVHLAGATVAKRWTTSYKKSILSSRIDSAALLFDTLKSIDHEVTHFVSASGISVYPNSKTKLYTEENDQVDNTFLAEVVVAWEAAADLFVNLGMEVTKVRTGIVLDKHEGALPKILAPIKAGFGATLGSGKQWQSWIHVDDLARIYHCIIHKQWEGVYNAVAPNPVTHKKMTKLIARMLDKTLWLPNVPGFFLRLILGDMAVLVLEGQLVSAQKLEKQGFVFEYYNLENALEDLL